MAKYMLYCDVDIDQFVRQVQADHDFTVEIITDELDRVIGEGRDYARVNVPKDTWSLYKSIRTFSYKPPIGYIAVKGFSAGGYIVNPKTKRLVDYAEIVDLGWEPAGRDPTWFFSGAVHYVETIIDSRMTSAFRKVMRR